MNDIRPFAALVVRPEWARRLVTGLAELPEDTGTLPPVAPPDPAAYAAVAAGTVRLPPGRPRRDRLRGRGPSVRQRAGARSRGRAGPARPESGRARRHDRASAGAGGSAARRRTASTGGRPRPRSRPDPCSSSPAPEDASRACGGSPTVRRPTTSSPSCVPRATTSPTATTGSPRRWSRGVPQAVPTVPACWACCTRWTACGSRRSIAGSPDRSTCRRCWICSRGSSTSRPRTRMPQPPARSGCMRTVAGTTCSSVTPVGTSTSRCSSRRSSTGWPQRIEIAPAKTEVDELTRRCDADGGVLFTLAPPPLASLTALADSGGAMPPKTTYFEPKPCAGIFRRPDRGTSD